MNTFLRLLIVVVAGIALIIGLSLTAAYSGYDHPSPFAYTLAVACIYGICKFLNNLLKKKFNNKKDEE